ncbi:hypothetical protein L6452_31447 [Arctium lappa]|uniref:Uncharacterized protein n=1 Tax=Arctium lappa TaxID=4217 RepID=A0ACB8Z270_ARCLA|nr:hypothetical protein L6452_31447 [Arctium lappa]
MLPKPLLLPQITLSQNSKQNHLTKHREKCHSIEQNDLSRTIFENLQKNFCGPTLLNDEQTTYMIQHTEKTLEKPQQQTHKNLAQIPIKQSKSEQKSVFI